MAARYWVGGGGTWDGSNTGNWSASSGGSGGASIPISSDDVYFDGNSSSGTVSLSGNKSINSISFSGSSVTLSGLFSTINVGGDITFNTSACIINTTLNFDNNDNTRTLTTNNCPSQSVGIRVGDNNTNTPTVNISGTLNIGATQSLLSSSGTLNTNNNTITSGSFTVYNSGFANLGSSTITLTKSTTGDVMYFTNSNVNFGTSTIKLQTTAACSIQTTAISRSFYKLDIATSSAITITNGSHSFNTISNSVQPATLKFPASSTQTVTNFSMNGTAGNLVTLNTGTGTGTFTLSKSSGLVSVDYLSITNSTATGGAGWYAGTHSTNGGGNTGWFFAAPAAGLLTFW